MVQAVAYSTFRNNLKSYMRKVNQDADMLLVTNTDPEDNVVVMSAADYDSLMETLRIYQNPHLRDKITRGLAQVRQGRATPHKLIDSDAAHVAKDATSEMDD
ncbi:type II toxin-antitoxin system Phd/YefM family antitoxin [Bifidobacterium leontopitheci]|uniref:Antitoxin n=1 Tax=Bifidobacterium leontopitheci TaxID=2650774 RepID=A0A6I1GPN0_9BIFI|nr:type II toxin-antitoxin system Phd/YefM family antitoxin [Bifidobacterium leontopitheci]KAB7791456.1 prevent-host-death protein [Bifidobacterium leontopitheci]